MAYRIVYDPEMKSKFPAKRRESSTGKYIVAIVLFVMLAALICQPAVNQGLKYILLPGDPDVTVSAGRELVEVLQDGGTVRESVTAFCMEILDGALR